MPQPFRPAARSNAPPASKRIEYLGHPRNRLQTGLEQGTHELAVAFTETGEGPAVARFEVGQHAARPGVALDNLLGGHFNAVLGEACDVRLHRQEFAVDQDAVAVEDHEIERHRRTYPAGSTATMTIVALSMAPAANTRPSS